MPAVVVAAAAVAFAVIATLNAGGYRYGTADQAFYIPAIAHQLDSTLYPRDWAMIGAQGRFFAVDEVFATLVRVTGLSLPIWFALAQAATLVALFAGAWRLGRAILTTPWGLAAWIAVLTLRHRIAKTGVNTLEGYFHPRMLVFGIGLLALADVVHGRRWRPVVLVLLAAALHPTTAALFLVIVLVAIAAGDRAWRRGLAGAIGVAVALGGAVVMTGAAGLDLAPMDAPWRALVATKDYTFPTTWSRQTWLINLVAPIVLTAAAWQRRRDGRLRAAEGGLVIGALALVGGFLLTLPLVNAGVPFAVQLQTSRAFWPVEILATLALVWAVVDRPLAAGRGARASRALALALVAVAAVRGYYVGFVESPDRVTLAVDLPDDDWNSALRWIAEHTPAETFVLADPGHAWQPTMGTAVRIGARRDVFLEETKDVAMAMYSRQAAHLVATRITALAGFPDASEGALRALAEREGLDVFVTPRTLELPLLHRAGVIAVYRLRP